MKTTGVSVLLSNHMPNYPFTHIHLLLTENGICLLQLPFSVPLILFTVPLNLGEMRKRDRERGREGEREGGVEGRKGQRREAEERGGEERRER